MAQRSWLKLFGYGLIAYIAIVLVVFIFFYFNRGAFDEARDQLQNQALTQLTAGDDLGGKASGSQVPAWSPRLGNANAELTIVEFSDFSCPFCKASHEAVRRLVAAYPDKVQIVYRHFPITTAHPLAFELAHASMCAHDQGKFWALHDRFFQYQDNMTRPDIREHAKAVGLDLDLFDQCQRSERWNDTIAKDFADAREFGGRGTPTWLINGVKAEGVISFEQWSDLVDSL